MASTPLRKRMNEGMERARSLGHKLSPVEEHHPERGRILTANCRVCGGGVMAEPFGDTGWIALAGNATRRKCDAILASKRRATELRESRKLSR